jgi:hypothetical protein
MIKRLTWLSILVACIGVVFADQLLDASEGDVFALQAQVHAGNRMAMRKLLSLKADGAVAEYVSVIMGGAIRKHPDAFLEEVVRSSRAQCDWCLQSLLGNLGDDFVDRLPEQVEELSKRREALRSAKADRVASLREKCVMLLDKQITQIQSLIEQGFAAKP